MAGGVWQALKRFILWDYERTTWQYDLMVVLILAFIFLAPRGWFRDQPRVPRASAIVMPPGTQGEALYFIEAELLAGIAPGERARKASEILRSRDGKRLQLIGLEPVVDSEGEIKGYVAVTGP